MSDKSNTLGRSDIYDAKSLGVPLSLIHISEPTRR